MILKIKLYYFSPSKEIDHTEECFLPEDMLDKPYHFSEDLPQDSRELLKDYTVQYRNEDGFVVVNNGGYHLDIDLKDFLSFSKELVKDKVSIEFREIPSMEPVYDELIVSNGKETLKFTSEDFDSENRNFRYPSTKELVPWLKQFTIFEFDDECVSIMSTEDKENVRLDQDNTQTNKTGINFELSSNSVKLNEYDPSDEILRSYHISRELFERSLGEAGAAYKMAEQIAEQTPEALEIIARYMDDAAEMGSIEAMDWLADYRSDNGRFDAWS